MFILNFNNISGNQDQLKVQQNITRPKVDDPDSLLKPHIPVTDCPIYKPQESGMVLPPGEEEKGSMKYAIIRVMLRAAGQIFTREKDPSPEMLFQFMEKITGKEATEKRKEAFTDFMDAIREQKPDVNGHMEEFFRALSDTWDKGEFEQLPDMQAQRPWPAPPNREGFDK